MKKILAITMAALMILALCAACATGGSKTSPGAVDTSVKDEAKEGDTINVWAFTNELGVALDAYKEYYKKKYNKEFPYKINITQKSDQNDEFLNAIIPAITSTNPEDKPDLYIVESAFALKFTQGDYSKYAATYKSLGIDVEKLLTDSKIAAYTAEIGRRASDNEIVGLSYQTNPNAIIYRRSIAKDVWGDDDPAVVAAKIGPGIDKFIAAGEEVKAKGYSLLSGPGDFWNAYKTINGVEHGWIVNDKLDIPKTFEDFFDIAKQLVDKDLTNKSGQWSDEWVADQKDAGPRKVFAFMGPAWLINYTLGANSPDTKGDWAVCEPPFTSWWGGSWTLANKDTKFKKTLGEFLTWMTLDTSDDGFLYKFASGALNKNGTKDFVSSDIVVGKVDGKSDFLGGQDFLQVYKPLAPKVEVKVSNLGQNDGTIQSAFSEAFTAYANGEKTKEQAISEFKANIKTKLGFDSVG